MVWKAVLNTQEGCRLGIGEIQSDLPRAPEHLSNRATPSATLCNVK